MDDILQEYFDKYVKGNPITKAQPNIMVHEIVLGETGFNAVHYLRMVENM